MLYLIQQELDMVVTKQVGAGGLHLEDAQYKFWPQYWLS
jgi:hypothetical protein